MESTGRPFLILYSGGCPCCHHPLWVAANPAEKPVCPGMAGRDSRALNSLNTGCSPQHKPDALLGCRTGCSWEGEDQRHPQHRPGAQTPLLLMSVCQGGRAGKELAVRERDVGLALQPLLGKVINFFWDLGRLI